MVYRNELKHIITPQDCITLCNTLKTVAKPDPFAGADGKYELRSLYFDNIYDKALREKTDGVNEREKFRIRYYKRTGYMRLEKKVKRDSGGYKLSAEITPEEAQRILNGDTLWMLTSGRALLMELYAKMKSQLLRPSVIVDYERIPFVYVPGNVRVTVDYNIRTGLRCTDFLNPECVMIPAGEPIILLEVKWDEYLPDCIRHAVQLKGRMQTAFSKYQICRIYG